MSLLGPTIFFVQIFFVVEVYVYTDEIGCSRILAPWKSMHTLTWIFLKVTVFVGGEILTKNNQTQCILISHTIIIEVLIPIPRVAFSSTYRRFQTHFPARECTLT